MERFILYTYKNIEEFNLFYSQLNKIERPMYLFKFQETAELLEGLDELDSVVIDISYLVEYLELHSEDKYAAINNFDYLNENCIVVVREQLCNKALEYLYAVFYDIKKIELLEEDGELEALDKKNVSSIPGPIYSRKVIYEYRNNDDLTKIIDFSNENNIGIISVANLNESMLTSLSNYKSFLFDMTSFCLTIKENPNLLFYYERIFNTIDNYEVIVRSKFSDELLDNFMLMFERVEHISTLLSDIKFNVDDGSNKEIDSRESTRVTCISKISEEQRSVLFDKLSKQLVGHDKFKKRFQTAMSKFAILNKIGDKKIFSILLLGPSGVGKTEVAKIINKSLIEKNELIKINFGNYSSRDSLNSLIGSPRGYVGCTEGELGKKILNSKTGIILCDEFEKATNEIYNFFLELLEDGKYTDTMGEEFNLDGYIVIFTSNMSCEEYYRMIPPELQSRIDMVCEFALLTNLQKRECIKLRVAQLLEKAQKSKITVNLPEEDIQEIMECDVSSICNVRDLNRLVDDKLLRYLVK